MGAINNAFNKAGWSILSLASATAKYRAIRNEEGKNRAKQSYNTAATIKKQNDELTKNQSKPARFFDDLPPEIDEQKIAEQKVLEEIAQKAKIARFGELPTVSEENYELPTVSAENYELPTVSAEHSETNIDAKDPEVQGLIELKQKNALRAAAGKRSQDRYQKIKGKLTGVFADASYIDDVWREISLDPDITDELIRKAGFTKTQILEEWNNYKNNPTDWMAKQNIRGGEYGLVGSVAESEDFSYFEFGKLLSLYIKAKAGGKTIEQQWEEHELSKAEKEQEEENYKVWQDESTEEEKDKIKTDRNFLGIFKFLQDDSTEEEKEKEKDETKTDKGIIF